MVGSQVAADLRETTLALYARAAQIAGEWGIVLADTKIELGRDVAGRLVLADEVLTPDSSRFWMADAWQPGWSTPSFDKGRAALWPLTPSWTGWKVRGWWSSATWGRTPTGPRGALPGCATNAGTWSALCRTQSTRWGPDSGLTPRLDRAPARTVCGSSPRCCHAAGGLTLFAAL